MECIAAQHSVPGGRRDNAPAKKGVHYAQTNSIKAAGACPVRGRACAPKGYNANG